MTLIKVTQGLGLLTGRYINTHIVNTPLWAGDKSRLAMFHCWPVDWNVPFYFLTSICPLTFIKIIDGWLSIFTQALLTGWPIAYSVYVHVNIFCVKSAFICNTFILDYIYCQKITFDVQRVTPPILHIWCDITQRLSCIVGSVGIMLWKGWRMC